MIKLHHSSITSTSKNIFCFWGTALRVVPQKQNVAKLMCHNTSIKSRSTTAWCMALPLLPLLWPLSSFASHAAPTSISPQLPQILANHPSNMLGNSSSNAFEPPNRGTPSHTASGGSRGHCPQDDNTVNSLAAAGEMARLVALLPHGQGQSSQQGQSMDQRPTFLVYVPPSSARSIFFSLKDTSGDYYYQTQFSLAQTDGILQFRLPETESGLVAGRTYRWAFALLCGDQLRPDSPLVEGTLQQIQLADQALNLNTLNLNTMPALEQAAFYRQADLWYDALAVLANLKQAQPDDPATLAAWKETLESIGLGSIATKSFLYPALHSEQRN
jgi:hypothetical protein